MPRTRSTTWITALTLAIGVHLGVLAFQVLDDTAEEAQQEAATTNFVFNSVDARRYATPRDREVRPPDLLAHCAEDVCVLEHAALADAFERRDAKLLRSVRVEPKGGGLELSGVRVRSLLGEVGLRSGDVLVQVDEHPLRDGADVEVLLERAMRGGFHLIYRRDDRLMSKRFELVDSARFRMLRGA